MEDDSLSPREEDDGDQDEMGEGERGDSSTSSALQPHRSSSRVMRNLAEKMRRDKLNTHINELATLVPMVSSSSKRMDKTSILRLSATFLRMNQLLTDDLSQSKQLIPQFFESMNWSQLMLDDMEGIMLMVTSSGKIVFISHTVEKTLGHLQLELLGQSLFNITCSEDHEVLRKNLTPDEDPTAESNPQEAMNEDSCSSGDTATFSNSSCSDQNYGRSIGSHKDIEKQRRSFFIRLRIRSISRSVQPQYEYVHVLGHLRVPVRPKYPDSTPSRHPKRESVISPNDIVLVAVVKPFKEMKVSELTLMEASKDEYVTRHRMDGTFIYSDHRISIISGYLSREVSGLSAFSFMHKDDVGWVLVALRQMLIHSDGPGQSVYRLQTKTGQFIYLRTVGYLEYNSETCTNDSFICINTVISEVKWKEEFTSMQQRFTPMIESQMEAGPSALASVLVSSKSISETSPAIHETETKDPEELNLAIKTLISDVIPASKQKGSLSSDKECTKTATPKSFPPLSMSVSTPPAIPSAKKPESPAKPVEAVKQDRPSVLRVNHSSTDTVSVVLPTIISPTVQTARKSVVSHSSQLVRETVSNNFNSVQEINYDPLDNRLQSPTSRHGVVIERTGVLCRLNSQNDEASVVKRKIITENDASLSGKRVKLNTSPRIQEVQGSSLSVLTSSSIVTPHYSNSSSLESSSSLPDLNLQSTSSFSFNDSSFTTLNVPDLGIVVGDLSEESLDPIEIESYDLQSVMTQPVEEPWSTETNVLEANLVRNHLDLDSSMALQGQQLTAIEQDLTTVPHHMSSTLHSNFTQLKAQHKKQQQILETLKQETLNHNLHHHVDELASNIQQDVGV